MLPKSTYNLIVLILTFSLAFAPPFVEAAKKTQKPCPGNSQVLPLRQKKKTVCVCEGGNGKVKPFNPGCSAQLFSFFTIEFCFAACTPQPTTSPKPPKTKHNKKDLKSDGALALAGAPEDDLDAGGSKIDKKIDWSFASPCFDPPLACPIFSSPENRTLGIASDFECVDPVSDLNNCGGCSSLGDSFKCPAPISTRALGGNAGRGLTSHGVRRSMCVKGECQIASCKRGYKIDSYYDEGFNNATLHSATTTTGRSLAAGLGQQGKWRQRCVPSSH